MPKLDPQLFLPKPLVGWVDHPGWLRASQSSHAWIQTGNHRVPLTVVDGAPWLTKQRAPRQGLTLFRLNRSTPAERGALEEQGASYSVFVHVEKRRRQQRLEPSSPGTLRLGPAGMRVAMAALLEPDDLAIASLAKRGVASLGQTHQTLKVLEEAGFVRRAGRGPQTVRSFANRSGVTDLLRDTAMRQRRPVSVSVFLDARKPEDLWQKLSHGLGSQAVLSGAAAAMLLGGPSASATSIPRTMVRIASDLPIEDAVKRLNAEPAESGANVSLVIDKARWGEVKPGEVRGVRVANPLCAWLDCMREPRGEDVARQLREAVLGY
jgi:hypothetical protein